MEALSFHGNIADSELMGVVVKEESLEESHYK
jgi:hypothetical protein